MARSGLLAVFLVLGISIVGIYGRVQLPGISENSGSSVAVISSNEASPKGPLESVCELCKQAASQMHDFLADPHSAASAVAIIESLACQGLPGQLGEQCTSVVEEFVPSCFKHLSAEISNDACYQAHVCTATNGLVSLPLRWRNSPESKCEACKDAMEAVLVIVNDVKTQAAILEKLHETCLRFKQKGLQEKCDLLVEVYFQQVIEILKGVSPGEICDAIKACDTYSANSVAAVVGTFFRSAHEALHAQAKSVAALVRSGGWGAVAVETYNPQECAACRLFVQLLKKRLEEPKNQGKIEEFLLDYCSYAGNRVQECKDAIEKYLPEILGSLDSFIDPKKVCEKAKICVPFPPLPSSSLEEILRLPSEKATLE